MKLFEFVKSRQVKILTAVLLLQVAVFYSLSHGEQVPLATPLAMFPSSMDSWRMIQDTPLEKEVLDKLKADDTMSRLYVSPETGTVANLFVAYFKSQREGQAPHSPKNCMPGSGWVPSVSEFMKISVPGQAQPIEVNHYVVAKGDQKSVVIYWYQAHSRVVASEYRAKVYVVLDAMRYNRTDTALVRVVVPVSGRDTGSATATAVKFVQSAFPVLRRYLPA